LSTVPPGDKAAGAAVIKVFERLAGVTVSGAPPA
jgi:hypothetical protein